ncbi:MAG TPA: PilC/PilY family type IV pilus protein, partial [Steroidobacter sp.]|nr:PilC/PilY family type IV pilus protein [Steroidobacter sp.]
MPSARLRHVCLLAACAATGLSGAAARADDTEIFRGNPANIAAPNILLVFDTSEGMGSNIATTEPYNPQTSYVGAGDCANLEGRVYWSNGAAPPSCTSANWLPIAQIKCAAALSRHALGAGGSGVYVDRFIRWGGRTNKSWIAAMRPQDAADLECSADSGANGNLSTTNPFPSSVSSTGATGVWTNHAGASYWSVGTGVAASLYSANYVVYWNQHRTPTLRPRIDIMKEAATNLVKSLSGVNVGLMRFSTDAVGGMVYPVAAIGENRTALTAAIAEFTAGGFAPLSETLFEAYRYFSGGPVHFGNSSASRHSAAQARAPAAQEGANYDSPADYSCQKNYIVFLTDGLPTADSEANSLIAGLNKFATFGGACEATGPNAASPEAGLCLVPLSRYMFSTDLRTDVAGQQNVRSYWIGFGEDVANGAPFEYLRRAGLAGGADAYRAQDSAALTAVLTSIVTDILQTSAAFTAPTLAVNAFNRTQSLNDLYVSVFQPALERHWPGNLKKYRIKTTEEGAVIVGVDGNLPVIDESTGLFIDAAQSFWSSSADGARVRDGGAANELPAPAARRVYTYLGSNPAAPVTLSASNSHAIASSNANLTAAMLGLSEPPDPRGPSRDSVIAWIRGEDVLDQYPWKNPPGPNDDRAEQRRALGDPLHARPSLVIYGGTTAAPDISDAAAFLPTNDGYLHAFDAATGEELWSFVPKELLSGFEDLFLNTRAAGKNYGLDGDVRALKFDVNGDGIVDPSAGDRVLLYFSQGRGGGNYYALDVTHRKSPRFMWRLGPVELPGMGQAWSTPAIARINISGAIQNSQKLVLVIGGGYDPVEDSVAYVAANSMGNRVFFVDAIRGTLLWSAGSSGATFNHPRMTHSIPASVAVLDTNSDGYTDRMYAGDMAAQLWRFDIVNGAAASSLVRGGVIASLGSHEEAAHAPANTRRFYNSPDIAAIRQANGPPYLNIAIGSGYRGHPLDTSAHDRFYSIRDYRAFSPMIQADYDALTLIRDGALVDITSDLSPAIPTNAPGWKLNLNHPGGWRGEKALGQATTVDGKIVFTTYTPKPSV